MFSTLKGVVRMRGVCRAIAVVALMMAVRGFAQQPPAGEVDLLLTNGHVVDGSGGPWMLGSVAITGDHIVYVGRAPVKAKKVIDVHGQVISPGFIDMHVHSEFGLSLDGRGLSKVTQGVTTEVMGEHLSAGPVLGPAVDDPMMVAPPVKRTWTTLGGFFEFLEKKGIGPNVVSYVGAGQVRASVMGYENRRPTPAEMEKIKDLIRQAMHEGAFGLSAGLVYVPNSFFTTDDMVELCKVAGEMGGIYSVHMRTGAGVNGLAETIEIARRAHIPVEIFHFQGSLASNPKNADIVNQARAEGVDVTANGYPYTAGWTYMRQLLPPWAQEGNAADITARLKQPDVRARVITDLKADPRPFGLYIIASANPDFDGLTLQQLADKMHVSVPEAMVNFLIKQNAEGFHITNPNLANEAGVMAAFKNPWLDVGSDGISLTAGVRTNFGHPHPRSFGTFTRVLAQVVRENHEITLEEAIRKMTSQAADRLGIADRGLLRQGMKADVVVFDPATVTDMSTYQQPEQYSKGIDWVFVNGKPVVAEGKPTNALPGRVLRGPAYIPGTK